MSYCRLAADSDVYVYRMGGCYAIHVSDREGVLMEKTPELAAATLLRLRGEGLMVPQRAIDGLLEETERP